MDYEMDELFPILAELTEKYTSGESSSVTYERAKQLMGAVLYCIGECEKQNVPAANKLTAKQAYVAGYEAVLQKVRRTQEKYNEMILNFCSYGNENYYDTVVKAVPGFFKYYDARFAPQETIIMMDYPTLQQTGGMTGIDAVEKYVEWIALEQEFMGRIPEAYVCEILTRFQQNYQKQFYNVCRIIFRHILGCMMIGKKLGTETESGDDIRLLEKIHGLSKDELKGEFIMEMQQMLEMRWDNYQALGDYLQSDIEDFVSELMNVKEYQYLKRIVVL